MRPYWIWATLCLFVGATPAWATPADDALAKVKSLVAPDPRITVFQVTASEQGSDLVATGKVLTAAQKRATLDALAALGRPVTDAIDVFPFAGTAPKPYAVASRPVLNIREFPKQSSQLVTQALMGQTMKLLRQEGAWWEVQFDHDGYIGWAEEKSIVRLAEADHKYWTKAKKVMLTQTRGDLLTAPRGDADVAARIYLTTTLPYLGMKGAFAELKLPDGRKAYAIEGTWKTAPAKGDPRCVPALIDTSKRFLGVPYLWGGTSALMTDCSGFTQQLYRLYGFDLPRDADQQQAAIKPVTSRAQLKPGDLLYFPGHTGLYIGNQEFIHSSVGNAGVAINSFNPKAGNFNPWYVQNYEGAGRVVN